MSSVNDSRPEDVHLPSPSVWPFVVGAGVSLLAFGVPTSVAFSALGGVLVAVGLWGWIEDLRHAR
jgi:hypothetical protein